MIKYIHQFYKNMSIQKKLLVLFSVQIIIPVIFMGIILYQNTHTIIQNKSISYMADILKMVELRMADFSDDMQGVTRDIIYDRKLYEILNQTISEPREIKEEDTAYIYDTLRKICLAEKYIQSVAIIPYTGKIYSYDMYAGKVVTTENMPYEALRKVATEHKGKASWYYDIDDKGEIQGVYLTGMINDNNTFEEKALLVILVNREALKNTYSELSTEFMQQINILSPDNKWIIGSEKNWVNDAMSLALEKTDKKWDYHIDTKSDRILATMQIEENGWKIIAEGSLQKLLRDELNHFRLLIVLIMICILIILSLFSSFTAVDFVAPINRLVEGIKKVDEENVYQPVIVDREDELGYLTTCFNKMSEEIDRLLNQVYKEQLTRKEAELKALQAQINPHFLFNTLESINWMAQLNNVPEIRDMVTSLGALMEASIGKGNPMVPLSKELHYIDSYILIMKNRYGERLIYESDIDEEVLKSRVPKLLLQPLIENAIYHGIDRNRKKGIIHLTIKKGNADDILIEIMDNGKGLIAEEVALMNQKFKDDKDDYLLGEDRKGIGLKNVNGRIKLFFGTEYGLSIESKYDVYTKIKVRIPVNN